MQYRELAGEKVSALGFGCMRLPVINNVTSDINSPLAAKILHHAIDNGVNYIDTAWNYHSFKSEEFTGEALKSGGYRNKVMLATKFPTWLLKEPDSYDNYLNNQLKNLQTDHIDFYLMHNITSNVWPKLQKFDVRQFLDKAKKDGRIRHAGFSFHDNINLFKEVIDSYKWDFCQIQYNYLDETFQAGSEGLEYAYSKGVGIVIMEPLRGGKLAEGLPAEAADIFKNAPVKRTPAAWALKWLLNRPEISVILSGMNTLEQVDENIETMSSTPVNSLTSDEIAVINKAKIIFKSKIKINCTTCGYCMPCPTGVAIPSCFNYYNNYYMFGSEDLYQSVLSPKQKASGCIECGQCVEKCPQSIAIPDELKKVTELFG